MKNILMLLASVLVLTLIAVVFIGYFVPGKNINQDYYNMLSEKAATVYIENIKIDVSNRIVRNIGFLELPDGYVVTSAEVKTIYSLKNFKENSIIIDDDQNVLIKVSGVILESAEVKSFHNDYHTFFLAARIDSKDFADSYENVKKNIVKEIERKNLESPASLEIRAKKYFEDEFRKILGKNVQIAFE